MNKKRDIKPCPFCGGKAKVGLIVTTVNCLECGARAGEYNTGYKAIEEWNKRVENKALKERVKFLEEALDTAYEDDAAGYEALMEEMEETKLVT